MIYFLKKFPFSKTDSYNILKAWFYVYNDLLSCQFLSIVSNILALLSKR